MACPLCESSGGTFLRRLEHDQVERDFYQCDECALVFIRREDCLSREEEERRYLLHDNSVRSNGYLNFLYRLIRKIKENIKDKNKKGLDYGSGPYPMLMELLAEEGYSQVEGYDPFFNPNLNFQKQKYDFITVCEVIEHIHDLKAELETLLKLLEKQGVMVWSTGIFGDIPLERWHYVKDATHINFFSLDTLRWVGEKYHLRWECSEKDLITFWKK